MNEDQTAPRPGTPGKGMRALDRLVGTWRLSGALAGTVRFEWLDGHFFLLQHVDFVHDGRRVRGIEVIGHERRFGEAPSEDIRSRFYDSEGFVQPFVEHLLDGERLQVAQEPPRGTYRSDLKPDEQERMIVFRVRADAYDSAFRLPG